MEYPVNCARLLFTDGTDIELSGHCSLGRARDNTVRITNEQVSRHHALIQCQNEGEFWIVDLGSSNGTSVNGRRVSRPARLADGDLIEIAGISMRFHADTLPGILDEESICSRSTLPRLVRRTCWLMVVDIIGSTRQAHELPAEELPQVNGAWFARCREIIDRCEGEVNQYLGDGFFCYWDSVTNQRGNVLAALRDLAALQKEAAPPFRIVLHVGEVVLSSMPMLAVIHLHGPEVIFTFRMEKLAAALSAPLLCSHPASCELAITPLAEHHASLPGYEGSFRFVEPDLATNAPTA